jgi:hypothetical protein
MEISNESLIKILKHQNKINQLVMHALENQPAIEEIPTQSTAVSKDGVPLPRLIDKIKNVIGVNILTVNEIMEKLLVQFPKLIEDTKKSSINYGAYEKLKLRVKSCLNYGNNFVITNISGIYGQRKYSNNTA